MTRLASKNDFHLSRRNLLAGGVGAAVAALLGGCTDKPARLPQLRAASDRRGTIASLRRICDAVGEKTQLLDFPDGSRALVLQTGGRLLALAEGDRESLLWHIPALSTIASATAFFAQKNQWRNVGGDRTWLAPEWNFFIADPARINDTYRVPDQVDPGHYSLRSMNGEVTAVTDFSQSYHRPEVRVSGRITKTWSAAADPLRVQGVSYAGYSQRTRLEISAVEPAVQSGKPVVLGLWNLLQLPNGGRMIIPTYARAEAQVVFGNIPKDAVALRERAVIYDMRAEGAQKISVLSRFLTGRCGYFHRTDAETATLVVRNFTIDPSAAYADPLRSAPEGEGYCVQACNVNAGDDRFSELEYHAPAIPLAAGATSSDASQVWTYSGSIQAVAEIARQLLGVDPLG